MHISAPTGAAKRHITSSIPCHREHVRHPHRYKASAPQRGIFNLHIIDRRKRQFDQGGWARFFHYSMGASLTSQPQHPPRHFLLLHYFYHGYPATLPPFRSGPLWTDHPPGDNFLAPPFVRIKHSMGALAPPTQARSLIILALPTPSHQTLGARLYHLFYQENYSTNTTQSSFINIAKQYSLWGLYRYFCSLILGTISKDAHDHLESFRCQRWGLMTRTDRPLT